MSNTLPSGHQIGDAVTLSFGTSGQINNCEVLRVHFGVSKIMYDVIVYMLIDGEKYNTRLYNIDSAFVTKL